MPYKIIKNVIYHKKNGKWSIKQRCKNEETAKKALRLLLAVEHGFTPTKKK